MEKKKNKFTMEILQAQGSLFSPDNENKNWL